jgi:glucose-6-phosphate dehydrogenase assembly protein OpcA
VVQAEEHNPTADLLAAWLAERLLVPVQRDVSGGPGITAATLHTEDGDVGISRPDGRNATLSWPGQPDRHVALLRRGAGELMAEELRALYPDEVYGEILASLAARQRDGG